MTFIASPTPSHASMRHARASARTRTRSTALKGALTSVRTVIMMTASSAGSMCPMDSAWRRMSGQVPHEQAATATSP